MAQGEIKTTATFFDWVEMLKTQVAGITNDFLKGVIIKALQDLCYIQLMAFEATQTNLDGIPVDALIFAALKAYLIHWEK